ATVPMKRQRAVPLLAALVTVGLMLSDAPAAPAPGEGMDYGPFLTGSLDRDKTTSERNSNQSTEQEGPSPNALAAKAVVVKLGSGAAVAFDTDLLRYAAGWTGGYLDLSKTHLTTPKGSTPLTPGGKLLFQTPPVPGDSPDGSFKDPRPHPFGPLPRSYGRYKGLYVHGDRVIFSYQVGDCDVLDLPQYAEALHGRPVFWRVLRLGATKTPHTVLLLEEPEGREDSLVASGQGLPPGVSVGREGRRLVLRVTPSSHERTARVLITPAAETRERVRLVPPRFNGDPFELLGGGPARYPEPVVTKGTPGTGDGAYVVDTLTLPENNPCKSWMRPSGLDFFSDG